MNKVKRYEIVSVLSGQFVYSVMETKTVCLVIFHFWLTSLPQKLHDAPLTSIGLWHLVDDQLLICPVLMWLTHFRVFSSLLMCSVQWGRMRRGGIKTGTTTAVPAASHITWQLPSYSHGGQTLFLFFYLFLFFNRYHTLVFTTIRPFFATRAQAEKSDFFFFFLLAFSWSPSGSRFLVFTAGPGCNRRNRV